MRERRGQKIVDRLEYDTVMLEYGVPFPSIPYRKMAEFLNDGSVDEVVTVNKAVDIVEAEAKEGRFGAFVTSDLVKGGNILFEVWVWDNEN